MLYENYRIKIKMWDTYSIFINWNMQQKDETSQYSIMLFSANKYG